MNRVNFQPKLITENLSSYSTFINNHESNVMQYKLLHIYIQPVIIKKQAWNPEWGANLKVLKESLEIWIY